MTAGPMSAQLATVSAVAAGVVSVGSPVRGVANIQYGMKGDLPVNSE